MPEPCQTIRTILEEEVKATKSLASEAHQICILLKQDHERTKENNDKCIEGLENDLKASNDKFVTKDKLLDMNKTFDLKLENISEKLATHATAMKFVASVAVAELLAIISYFLKDTFDRI